METEDGRVTKNRFAQIPQEICSTVLRIRSYFEQVCHIVWHGDSGLGSECRLISPRKVLNIWFCPILVFYPCVCFDSVKYITITCLVFPDQSAVFLIHFISFPPTRGLQRILYTFFFTRERMHSSNCAKRKTDMSDYS